MVDDLRSGAVGSSPQSFAVSGGDLVFTANDGKRGVELWSLDLGAYTLTSGRGCGNGLRAPTMGATDPILGRTMSIWGADAPSGASGYLLAGLPGPAIPLGAGCDLFLQPGSLMLLGGFRPLTGSGTARLAVPAIPGWTGVEVGLQCVFAPTATGYELTNGLRLTLGR